MKFVLSIVLALFAYNAAAEVEILKITGVSAVKSGVPGVTTIFGGMAGQSCNHSPCNSCESMSCQTAPFCACNPNRITDDQIVTIQVRSKSPVKGYWTLTNQYGLPQFNFGTYVPGKIQTLQLNWSQLCNGNTGMGMSCEGPTFDASLFLGIAQGDKVLDSTTLEVITLNPTEDQIDDCTGKSNAICGFRIVSMKGGAALQDLQADQAFPAWIKTLRVFVSATDFAHASPTQADLVKDFEVDASGTIHSSIIPVSASAMTYFRLATVDIAGNVSNFISPVNIQSTGHCSYPVDLDPDDGCLYRSSPRSRH